ncbi:MAG: hypothetical protein K6E49_06860 [Lachnospiraceae bacterium]|nr:hypothetical protein [Lachnospiraceae bacterium]
MDKSILYLQANERIANSLRGRFEDEGVEFIRAGSAADAFELLKQREFCLTLTDGFIPDMRVHEFVKECAAEYPDMILDVCMDLTDPAYVPMIVNEQCVRKVFLPPWNVEDIVEGVKASIDEAFIHRDLMRRINELADEEKTFAQTIDKLKNSLLRQQYSYNKIAPFFNRVLDAFLRRKDMDRTYSNFVKRSCDKMLRLQTTAYLKTSDLQKILYDNMTDALKKNDGVSVAEVKSCLYGDVPRSAMADLTFAMWILAVIESVKCDRAQLFVDSRYVTSRKCEYRLMVRGNRKAEVSVDIQLYIANILSNIIDEYQKYDTPEGWTYELRITL